MATVTEQNRTTFSKMRFFKINNFFYIHKVRPQLTKVHLKGLFPGQISVRFEGLFLPLSR